MAYFVCKVKLGLFLLRRLTKVQMKTEENMDYQYEICGLWHQQQDREWILIVNLLCTSHPTPSRQLVGPCHSSVPEYLIGPWSLFLVPEPFGEERPEAYCNWCMQ
jgi:hypothetical protein